LSYFLGGRYGFRTAPIDWDQVNLVLDGMVRLRNIKTPEGDSPLQQLKGVDASHKAILKGHTAEVLCVALSPDRRTLASGSLDKIIHLWDVHTRKLIATLEGHTKEILIQ
jgi:WD40 repeat protein